MQSEAAKRVISEIEREMRIGSVPAEVNSFDQLHDFVDANQFIVNALEITDFSETEIAQANAVIDEVNQWLDSDR